MYYHLKEKRRSHSTRYFCCWKRKYESTWSIAVQAMCPEGALVLWNVNPSWCLSPSSFPFFRFHTCLSFHMRRYKHRTSSPQDGVWTRFPDCRTIGSLVKSTVLEILHIDNSQYFDLRRCFRNRRLGLSLPENFFRRRKTLEIKEKLELISTHVEAWADFGWLWLNSLAHVSIETQAIAQLSNSVKGFGLPPVRDMSLNIFVWTHDLPHSTSLFGAVPNFLDVESCNDNELYHQTKRASFEKLVGLVTQDNVLQASTKHDRLIYSVCARSITVNSDENLITTLV